MAELTPTDDLQFLTDAVATTDGVWQDWNGIKKASIQINGVGTATVEIDVSNAAVKPANSVHGESYDILVNIDAMVVIEAPFKWLKVRVTAWTSGTINARARREFY